MTRRVVFAGVTFLVGWMAQAAFLYVVPSALPTPHWLLLATLAVGGGGRVTLAQGLGFFWGLALDVYGGTPFGAQGGLLALAGFSAGMLSRKLNTGKPLTQEAMALTATALFILGVLQIGRLFPGAGGPPDVRGGAVVGSFLLNGLAAPAVFWLMGRWVHLGNLWTGRPVSHD